MRSDDRTIGGFSRTVFFLGVVSLLTDASSEMIYPLLPVFLVSLGASATFLGLIEGVAESTASLVKLASGWWSDRLGRRKAIVIGGYALSTCARPLVALAGTGWHVLGIRLTDRLGKGLRTAPRDALIAASTPENARGRAFSFHRAMDHAGAVVGPLIASLLLATVVSEIRVLFALAAIPGILAVVVLIRAVRDAPSVSALTLEPVPLGFARLPARFRRVLAVVTLFTLGNSSDAFLLLKASAAGIGPTLIPLLWIVLHVSKALSSMPAGVASDRIGRPRLIVAGWLLYAAVYAGFALATESWHVWLLFLCYGVFFGLTEGVEKAYIADLIPGPLRGTAFGWYHAAIGIAALPASLLMGAVWDRVSPSAAFALGAGLALLSALLFWAITSSPPSRNVHPDTPRENP